MLTRNAILVRRRQDNDLYEFNYDMNIDGILAAQGYGQICSHIDIVNRYKVKLFVELGMYMGGTLPHLIPNLVLDDEFSYMGFEIRLDIVNQKLIQFASQCSRCHIILEDLFTDANINRIATNIRDARGPVYVFCDGGNKPGELLTFSKFLRIGDIISVHDYTEDQTGEIRDVDLEKLSSDFEPLDEDWRKNILWLPTFMRVR